MKARCRSFIVAYYSCVYFPETKHRRSRQVCPSSKTISRTRPRPNTRLASQFVRHLLAAPADGWWRSAFLSTAQSAVRASFNASVVAMLRRRLSPSRVSRGVVQLRPVYGIGGPGWLHEVVIHLCAQVAALLFVRRVCRCLCRQHLPVAKVRPRCLPTDGHLDDSSRSVPCPWTRT